MSLYAKLYQRKLHVHGWDPNGYFFVDKNIVCDGKWLWKYPILKIIIWEIGESPWKGRYIKSCMSIGGFIFKFKYDEGDLWVSGNDNIDSKRLVFGMITTYLNHNFWLCLEYADGSLKPYLSECVNPYKCIIS